MKTSFIDTYSIQCSNHHFKNGDEIFHLGQQATAIFRVLKGHVQLFRDDLDGHRIIIYQAYAGHFFAEASMNAAYYHCTALCMSDCEIQEFNSSDFRQKLTQNTDFCLAWIDYLSKELRHQRTQSERLNINTAAERITHYVLTEGNEHKQVNLKGSLSDLAQVLGLTRESLYRTLSKMKKAHQIEHKGDMIKLL